jgi:hypothetical protein
VRAGMTDRHPLSVKYHEFLSELGDLHDKKQQDYGSDADPFANVRASERWGIPPWVGALMRADDKMARLRNFARKGQLANESAEDSMRDIAVYMGIAKVLYDEESGKKPPQTMREAVAEAYKEIESAPGRHGEDITPALHNDHHGRDQAHQDVQNGSHGDSVGLHDHGLMTGVPFWK